MQYTVNRGEKGKVEVKVTVPKTQFEASYSDVLGFFGKDANIAGFRVGKAPNDVVERHIGLSRILNETAGKLVSLHLGDILKKEQFSPIDSPKIAVDSLIKSADFAFTASFTQRPKVEIGAWKKIKIKKLAVKRITAEDIDQSIKNIFEAWKKSKNSEKDQMTSEKNEEQGKFIYDAQGNKVFFDDKKGKEGSEGKAGGKIDDEFAKAIGAKDLAHLKELVTKDLETLVLNEVEGKFEDELFAKLREIAKVEVPEVLVDDELNRILLRMNSELERQGQTLQKYLEEQKTTVEEMKTTWREQAEKNVATTLVLDEIGKSEKIIVAPTEVEEALASVTTGNVSEEQKTDLRNYVAVSIFQAKTLDLVKKIVTAAKNG